MSKNIKAEIVQLAVPMVQGDRVTPQQFNSFKRELISILRGLNQKIDELEKKP